MNPDNDTLIRLVGLGIAIGIAGFLVLFAVAEVFRIWMLEFLRQRDRYRSKSATSKQHGFAGRSDQTGHSEKQK